MSVFDVFFNGHRFPYSNLHELNLDWLIETVKNLSDRVEALAASIPSVFVKKVDGHDPDSSGNVALPGIVRKVFNTEPNENGNVNPAATSGAFTVNGNFTVTGSSNLQGSLSVQNGIHSPSCYSDSYRLQENSENELPEIQIYQQSAGVVKFGLPTEGNVEQFAKLRIADPTEAGHALTLGAYRKGTKPLSLVIEPDGYSIEWADVTGFTYQSIADAWTLFTTQGGPKPSILLVYPAASVGSTPGYIICEMTAKAGDEYYFTGGYDVDGNSYTAYVTVSPNKVFYTWYEL